MPASLAQDALAEASTSETGAKPKAGFGWSHSFLHLKQWHPLSFKNQEKLFLAEQAEADRRRRDEEAAKEFAANAEFFKNTELLSAKDRTALRNKQQLAFMYQKPPGFDAMLEKQAAEAKATEDAARAEEEAAARAAEREAQGLPPLAPEDIALRKSRKLRKDAYGRSVLTSAEATELAGAPVAQGASATTRANPLGKIIRATQCKRCGGFGHDSGDRECPMRDHNPNDAFRAKLEDPLTLMRAREALREGSRRLELKAPMTAAGGSPTRGGLDPAAANQQMVYDLGEGADAHGETAEGGGNGGVEGGGVLASLPKAERKRLVKEFREHEKAAKRAKVAAAEAFLRNAGISEREREPGNREKKSRKSKKERRRDR